MGLVENQTQWDSYLHGGKCPHETNGSGGLSHAVKGLRGANRSCEQAAAMYPDTAAKFRRQGEVFARAVALVDRGDIKTRTELDKFLAENQ